jgi:aldose 1-epimerase
MVVVLTAGLTRVELDPEAGGRISQICVEGTDLLRGREHASEGWQRWGCYPLLPWSNRIPGGSFTFGGRVMQAPVNNDDGSALHGLAATRPWTVTSHDDRSADLEIEVAAGSYTVRGTQSFTVSESALDHDLAVTNVGREPVPVGLGIHPWFRVGPVCVPADAVWAGDGPLPTGGPVPVGPDLDLRVPRVPPPMDRCFTELTASHVDAPGVRLSWTGPMTQVVVYSETPGWVCVEPVTMANDGFRLAAAGQERTGVLVLGPGESAAVSYRYAWTTPSGVSLLPGSP